MSLFFKISNPIRKVKVWCLRSLVWLFYSNLLIPARYIWIITNLFLYCLILVWSSSNDISLFKYFYLVSTWLTILLSLSHGVLDLQKFSMWHYIVTCFDQSTVQKIVSEDCSLGKILTLFPSSHMPLVLKRAEAGLLGKASNFWVGQVIQ